LGGDVAEAAGLCAGLRRPVRAAYEAGPTGDGLARELERRGVQCVVAAPSKIPRASGDRIKTDRRDAEHLVRLLLAGRLHAVSVPGPEEEALRDLVRAREAVRVDLMRCRHRLSKLLLRHGIRFDDGHGGRTVTAPGWPASSWAGRRRRPRWSMRAVRSTCSCTAARRSSARWLRCWATRRGRSRSPGCVACAGSTP